MSAPRLKLAYKTCKGCGKEKPLSDYYKANRGTTYQPLCKECDKTRAKDWMRAKRAADPNYGRLAKLRNLYGLSQEDFDAILTRQGGSCAICKRSEPTGRGANFHVDHDHSCCPGNKSCGKCVRGLLCHGCNVAIGALADDPDKLLAAAFYVLRSRDALGAVTY